jgi:putative ABC transport system permease protein
MSGSAGPRLARTLARLASRLVPSGERTEWLREWEGELVARWEELRATRTLTLRTRLDLLLRASGSFVDAISYERWRWTMGGFWQDVKIAARGLAKRPGFSAIIVLTLGVGVGANTAIFSVARDVLLRPFPYPDADRVVSVEGFDVTREGFAGNVTYPNVFDLDAAASNFEAIGAARWWVPALEDERGSIVVRGATVTANFFTILGMEAGLGRFFGLNEEGEGRENQVVLSHAFWVDRFGADPGLVGSDVRLSGESYRVIGVTPSNFEDPWLMGGPGAEPQVWRTVASPPSDWPRSGRSWRGIARVRPDVTLEAAQDELDAVFAGLIEEYPEANLNRVMRITPIREVIAGPAEPVLYTLLGAVGLLLLIACANLANLLLGRVLDREGELAVHRALGAPGWRIFNRSLAEAGLLALAGAVVGLVLATWLGGLARGLGPMLPRPVTGELDPTMTAFALSVALGAGLIFGLAPALHSARSSDALPGRHGARGRTLSRSGSRLRRGFVVAELALTTALLIGSGLLVRSFQRLGAVELGLETEGVVGIDLHGSAWWDLEPAAAQAQWDDVLASVRAVPGVQAAGAIDYLPLSDDYSCDGIQRDDQPPPGPGEGRCAEVRVVLPGAIEAMRIPLVRGRLLDERDGPDQPGAAVIDENMAEAFWPGEDPVGAVIMVHTKQHEVVGIVGNMRHFGPGGTVRPMVYLHAPQEGWNGIARGLRLIARGPEAAALVDPIRRAVADVSSSIAIGDIATLDSLLRTNMAGARFRTLLMAAFGITALLLAVLGITGVMTYSVARRTRELGVRLALGAKPEEVRGLVVREGRRLVLQGVAIGLLGAATIADALRALLFEVSVRDPWVYGIVTALLIASAMLACYLPARRASRVDPIEALAIE